MFNATFTVNPIPGTDKVVVGITPKSLFTTMVKTIAWYAIPIVGLIVIGEWRDSKQPTNTEDHLPEDA